MAFRRWFPRNLAEQATFMRSFTIVFGELADFLGFTAADVEKLEQDTAVLQYLSQMDLFLNNYKKSFQKLRDSLTGGEDKVETAYAQFTPPAEPPIVPCGIFNRLFLLSDRIAASENYSPVIGAQLGMLPKSVEPLRADEVTPKIKARALPGAQIEAVFVRGRTDGICFYIRRMGSEEWHDAGRFFYSPAVFKITLTEADKPEQIQLLGQHLKGNEPFGNVSAPTVLTITP